MPLHYIACIAIRPGPQSAGYEPHQVGELAESIRQFGILRPVLLRKIPGGYVIVRGERRWRAALSVGLSAIPAYIVEDPAATELPEVLGAREPRALSMVPGPSPSSTVRDVADWDR
jgi:ParB family chromosome partitioning protein